MTEAPGRPSSLTPMAVPHRAHSRIKSGTASRRDHVLNLLPPLTVLNDDQVSMHERLFADDPPLNTRSGSFPRKILRHAEPFTFYSAPTKGELNLMAQKRRHTREKEKEKERGRERERERGRESQRAKTSPASNDSDRRGRIPRGTEEPENTSLSEIAMTAEQSTGELTVDKAGPSPAPEISDGERESGNEEHGLVRSTEDQPSCAAGFFLT